MNIFDNIISKKYILIWDRIKPDKIPWPNYVTLQIRWHWNLGCQEKKIFLKINTSPRTSLKSNPPLLSGKSCVRKRFMSQNLQCHGICSLVTEFCHGILSVFILYPFLCWKSKEYLMTILIDRFLKKIISLPIIIDIRFRKTKQNK